MSSFLIPRENWITPPDGKVLSCEKTIPIVELNDDPKHEKCYAFKRGEVNITEIKKKLFEMAPSKWDDENQDGNVKLTRPAHDAWGIKKIMFVFCDDFLQKCLVLPWSQSSEWKEFLKSVYNSINIDESRVVRCLLAKMPPGSSIPVHHDTGNWVKHTHRCHLAIQTDDQVDFMIGPNPENMKKVRNTSILLYSSVRWKGKKRIL